MDTRPHTAPHDARRCSGRAGTLSIGRRRARQDAFSASPRPPARNRPDGHVDGGLALATASRASGRSRWPASLACVVMRWYRARVTPDPGSRTASRGPAGRHRAARWKRWFARPEGRRPNHVGPIRCDRRVRTGRVPMAGRTRFRGVVILRSAEVRPTPSQRVLLSGFSVFSAVGDASPVCDSRRPRPKLRGTRPAT